MLLDLRFALRQISKNPGFAAVAVFTLALGIGANAAIFSMINSVLIEALPYPNPEELTAVFEVPPSGGFNAVSGGAFKDWRDHGSLFAHLAVFEDTRQNFTGRGQPERVAGLKVSSDFLHVLGIEPLHGRGFAAGEDAVGGDNQVVVLTHRLWQSRYGGAENVVGRTISLNQIPHTVIGVLPPDAVPWNEALYLVPIVIDLESENWERSGHWRNVIARLRPGVTPAKFQTELRGVKERLASEYPAFKEVWSVAVVPLQEAFAGPTRPILRVLLGTVALVLLIACANVSNLLLARGNDRSREMAIRAALGAHSWRIVRQSLLESLILALLGCGVGLLGAMFGIDFLKLMFASELPRALQPELNANVLVFSVAVACGAALIFGILPALRASKPDLNHDLKEAARRSVSPSKRRSQTTLVVAEFALTLILLVGAGLFLKSFALLLDADPGFDPKETLAFDLSFPDAKYPEAEDRLRFIRDLRERLEALPGVLAVGASSSLPLSRYGRTEFVSRADGPEKTDYVVGCDFVSGDYTGALGLKLVRGRFVNAADNVFSPLEIPQGDDVKTAPRVLVISTGIARDLYPDEDPIGRRLRFLGESWEIVGIVAPMRHFVLDRDPQPKVYLPQAHFPWRTSLVMKSALEPTVLAEAARKTVLAADPDQPIANVRTLEEAVRSSLSTRRMTLVLLGLFAMTAVSLAAIGIYGVMSYAIGQRARELSIRSVLGAERRHISRLVLAGGLRPSIAGIGIGLLAALGLGRFLESLLFQVQSYDPRVFLSAMALLATVAAVSIYVPARRAANADPIEALRNE